MKLIMGFVMFNYNPWQGWLQGSNIATLVNDQKSLLRTEYLGFAYLVDMYPMESV